MMDEVAIQNQTVFRLSARVYIERFEDGALLVCLEKHKLIELNPTADEVLALTDGKCTFEEVAAAVAQNHEVPVEEVLEDIKDLYRQLHSWNIFEEVTIHLIGSEKEI